MIRKYKKVKLFYRLIENMPTEMTYFQDDEKGSVFICKTEGI